jgi:hypothetical protein
MLAFEMRIVRLLLTASIVAAAVVGRSESTNGAGETTIVTNGPAVFTAVHIPPPSGLFTNSEGKLIHRPVARSLYTLTNYTFEHFLPSSLNQVVWTNLLALTNGRTTDIWSVREHPPDWPAKPPIVQWDTNGLMWGMRGLMALSPCWQVEGAPGQVPITALTRRHGYARGHGLGNEGFTNDYGHGKIWFVLPDNKIFQTTVRRGAVRTRGGPTQQDYTILIFKDELPLAIQPLRVVSFTNLMAKLPIVRGMPWPLLMTEQTGHVSAGLPGFIVDVMKGGDSGAPNLLPLPGELIFCGGRTTSPPSPQMQADMDELCRLEHLDPKRYQMQWVDLSAFPSFLNQLGRTP